MGGFEGNGGHGQGQGQGKGRGQGRGQGRGPHQNSTNSSSEESSASEEGSSEEGSSEESTTVKVGKRYVRTSFFNKIFLLKSVEQSCLKFKSSNFVKFTLNKIIKMIGNAI